MTFSGKRNKKVAVQLEMFPTGGTNSQRLPTVIAHMSLQYVRDDYIKNKRPLHAAHIAGDAKIHLCQKIRNVFPIVEGIIDRLAEAYATPTDENLLRPQIRASMKVLYAADMTDDSIIQRTCYRYDISATEAYRILNEIRD